MGRQWLLAKREVASLRKSQATGKYLKEIMVAAKHGGADPSGNARLFAACEKARKESVSRDAITRAINKGAGIGGEKMTFEHLAFEGYAPHKVPVIVEVLTDNHNRTAPEIRVLFKKGQLGTSGSNKSAWSKRIIPRRPPISKQRPSKPVPTRWRLLAPARMTISRRGPPVPVLLRTGPRFTPSRSGFHKMAGR
jgi:hypothetical protein